MLFNGIDGVIKLQADINHQDRQGGLGSFTALFLVLYGSWFHNDDSSQLYPNVPWPAQNEPRLAPRSLSSRFDNVGVMISPRCRGWNKGSSLGHSTNPSGLSKGDVLLPQASAADGAARARVPDPICTPTQGSGSGLTVPPSTPSCAKILFSPPKSALVSSLLTREAQSTDSLELTLFPMAGTRAAPRGSEPPQHWCLHPAGL